MAFDLEWSGKSGEGAVRTESMVLRMEPPEAIVETSRLRDFEILGVAGDVVPVPPCYWVDAEGAYLPHPALIYGFAAGDRKCGVLGKSVSVSVDLGGGRLIKK